MKKLRVLSLLACLTLFAACASVSAPGASGIPGKTPLKMNPAVESGTLDNGMSWSVLRNAEPRNRLSLRLAVRAGSILEDDDQKGVAHFVEHMAFNGTEHFAKHELVDYFESIGMSFGPEINAYTSFDETVYMLEIPADDPAILEKSLLVLHDWASALSFESEEIEKERGVVIEEWRLGRGAQGRLQDKQIPFLFAGSRYAERLPIGDPEIIKTISRERVVDFYKTWYRPELMTVVMVGDADTSVMKAAIEKILGPIPASKDGKKRTEYEVPARKDTGLLVLRDPEASYTMAQMLEQQPVQRMRTVADFRRDLASGIAKSAFNARLTEKTVVAEPLMLAAEAGSQRIVNSAQLNYLFLVPTPGSFGAGFTQLLEELARYENYGITESELERSRVSMLDSIRQAWLNRDKVESSNWASGLVDVALRGDPLLSVQDTYDLYNAILPEITVAEVNRAIVDWYHGRGTMLMVTAQDAVSDVPADAELKDLWQNWKPSAALSAYSDGDLARPLYEAPAGAVPSPVVREETVSKNGIVQWTLSNGAKVLAYPTDYKADEIQFMAFSRGGLSLVSDADYPSAAISAGYAEMSGLNGFSMTDLGKKLAGKTVSVSPWVSDTDEGLSGSSSVADLETLLQLVNLEFTRASFSDEAFLALKAQYETVAAARLNNPGDQFTNLKSALVYGTDSIRHAPLTKEFISLMDADRSEAAFRSRFANAGDFTFVFVGNLDMAVLKGYVETYLSVLPGTPVREEAKALSPPFPAGIASRTLEMGIDPKSRVFFAFGKRVEFSAREYELFDAMCSLLDIRLREVIREDMSGSYGVRVNGNLEQRPERKAEIMIEFGCEPGREDALSAAVLEQIKWLQSAPVPESYIVKLRENFRRSSEEGLKKNGFWLYSIVNAIERGRPLDSITDIESVAAEITGESMQAMARKYLDTGNYVKAWLLPEERK